MTSNFALSLSFEGIQLLHRVPSGWHLVGEASIESEQLGEELAKLRAAALLLEPYGMRTKLVLPHDQIKYLAIDSTQTDLDDIHAALEGETPYTLSDLMIDYDRTGGRTHIAAVARETMREAEVFAFEHQFNPISFCAIPDPFTFRSEIFFGATTYAMDLLPSGTKVTRETEAVEIIGRATIPDADLISPRVKSIEPSDGVRFEDIRYDDHTPAPALEPVLEPEPAREEAVKPKDEPVAAPAKTEDDTSAPKDSDMRQEDLADGDKQPAAPSPKPEPEAKQPALVPGDVAKTDIGDAQPKSVANKPKEPKSDTAKADTSSKDATEIKVVQLNQPPSAKAEKTSANEPAKPVDKKDTPTSAAKADPDQVPADKAKLKSETATETESDADSPQRAAGRRYRTARRSRILSATVDEFAKPPPVVHEVVKTGRAPAVGSAPEAQADPGPQPDKTPKSNERAAAAAKPAANTNKKLIIGGAIAASIALIGVLVWAFTPTSDGGSDPTVIDVEPVAGATLPPPNEEATVPTPAPAEADVQTAETEIADEPPLIQSADLTEPATPDIDPLVTILPDPDAPAAVGDVAELQTPDADAADPLPDAGIQQTAEALPEETPPAAVGAPVLRGRVLSPDEAAQVYAATGVWQRAPRVVDVPETTSLDGFNSIDPIAIPDRAVEPALPDWSDAEPDLSFVEPSNPPPPDTEFDLDENGFVRATPEGAMTPEGALVIAGRPDIEFRARPELDAQAQELMAALAPSADGIPIQQPTEDTLRPRLRPQTAVVADANGDTSRVDADAIAAALAEAAEEPEVTPGAVSLTGLRPALRPTPPEENAADTQEPEYPTTPDITSVIAAIEQAAPPSPYVSATAQAVTLSKRPDTRPRNFDRVVASAIARQQQAAQPSTQTASTQQPQRQQTASVATQRVPATSVQPQGPVPGGVARAATIEGAIKLRDVNLIGVYGRPNERRALVRLANGDYVRVAVGSSLNGGQVTAIGDNALNYVKRGRTYFLEVPSG